MPRSLAQTVIFSFLVYVAVAESPWIWRAQTTATIPHPSRLSTIHTSIPAPTVCAITARSLTDCPETIGAMSQSRWVDHAISCLSTGLVRRETDKCYDTVCSGGILRHFPNQAAAHLEILRAWSTSLPDSSSGSPLSIPQMSTKDWIENSGSFIDGIALESLVAEIDYAERPFYVKSWFMLLTPPSVFFVWFLCSYLRYKAADNGPLSVMWNDVKMARGLCAIRFDYHAPLELRKSLPICLCNTECPSLNFLLFHTTIDAVLIFLLLQSAARAIF